MKLVLVSIVLCAAIYAASAMNMIASSSRALNRREANLVRRLAKRQAYSDPNCDPRRCAIPNCGKDTIAGTLPGECCERCIPWEYAQAIGLHPRGPQLVQDPRPQQHQPAQDTYNQHSQPQRVDVYIFGPDDGARVSAGQSIYFDCEVVSPYNQNAQPRWSRSGNQPLPYKAQSTILPGNRKIARLTVPDATQADAGRYECSAGTGNSNDQASIDLQVTDGRYYVPPQPQPQPQYPQNDPRYQHQYNQPGYYPPQPQPQPQPEPQPQPQPHYQPDNQDAGDEEENEEPAAETTTAAKPVYPPAAGEEHADGGAEDTEYPEDYTENEK